MQLTLTAIFDLYQRCSAMEGDAPADMVEVHGAVFDMEFSKARLQNHRPAILALLAELPEPFRTSRPFVGGGWSFLNMLDDRHGRQWAYEHWHTDMLLLLALGADAVEPSLAERCWNALFKIFSSRDE